MLIHCATPIEAPKTLMFNGNTYLLMHVIGD
jgi:hypothetical protein